MMLQQLSNTLTGSDTPFRTTRSQKIAFRWPRSGLHSWKSCHTFLNREAEWLICWNKSQKFKSNARTESRMKHTTFWRGREEIIRRKMWPNPRHSRKPRTHRLKLRINLSHIFKKCMQTKKKRKQEENDWFQTSILSNARLRLIHPEMLSKLIL